MPFLLTGQATDCRHAGSDHEGGKAGQYDKLGNDSHRYLAPLPRSPFLLLSLFLIERRVTISSAPLNCRG